MKRVEGAAAVELHQKLEALGLLTEGYQAQVDATGYCVDEMLGQRDGRPNGWGFVQIPAQYESVALNGGDSIRDREVSYKRGQMTAPARRLTFKIAAARAAGVEV
jgi:hypothetical protein